VSESVRGNFFLYFSFFPRMAVQIHAIKTRIAERSEKKLVVVNLYNCKQHKHTPLLHTLFALLIKIVKSVLSQSQKNAAPECNKKYMQRITFVATTSSVISEKCLNSYVNFANICDLSGVD
jgi:precorrin-3B methylase